MSNQIKLDVGSGRAKFKGHFTLDSDPKVGADILGDIFKQEEWKLVTTITSPQPLFSVGWDGDFDEIRAHHILEHLDPKRKTEVMRIFYDLLKPGGILDIEVPIAGTVQSFQDPTHISFWNRETFRYFTKGDRFGEAFAKRNTDARLFEKIDNAIVNGWIYKIKFKKL